MTKFAAHKLNCFAGAIVMDWAGAVDAMRRLNIYRHTGAHDAFRQTMARPQEKEGGNKTLSSSRFTNLRRYIEQPKRRKQVYQITVWIRGWRRHRRQPYQTAESDDLHRLFYQMVQLTSPGPANDSADQQG
jgi:hypothetical protein